MFYAIKKQRSKLKSLDKYPNLSKKNIKERVACMISEVEKTLTRKTF